MERWTEQAACAEEDPELFFPVSSQGPGAAQTQRAKEVCARCPVQATCLRWALDTDQVSGIWGGTGEKERAAIRRREVSRARTRLLSSPSR
ncbi:WhiB family transcriptional regulator [Streptomyces candidus]|uniref:Transcriptional regulator WhiB n=1 Tax=Streptomyces candidus TaxID=67283 RepID=A0A7X0HI52_9ACTN|nr:WhiB family transcriptional regulator [Streptomyces candidus]MBB6436777.1 WhiB family redox-sensing transcriptional regulator [Streptomyces candidus]GHH51365.1 transcriptional regulator WhiB [Streptomyces candidus]